MRQGSARKLTPGKTLQVKAPEHHIDYEGVVIRVTDAQVIVKVTRILPGNANKEVAQNQQRDVHFTHIVNPTEAPKKKKKKK